MTEWNGHEPIYRQLRDLIMHQVLTGALPEGEAARSVRRVAADERINPLTVSKAYQLLVDEGILESRRGMGMFVTEGARQLALQKERERFLSQEWPQIEKRLRALEIDLASLINDSGEPNG